MDKAYFTDNGTQIKLSNDPTWGETITIKLDTELAISVSAGEAQQIAQAILRLTLIDQQFTKDDDLPFPEWFDKYYTK